MDLDLTRVDYIQVGLTHPKCARLLPSAGIKAQQKVRVDEERRIIMTQNKLLLPLHKLLQ